MMAKKQKVVVVMPAYNAAKTLKMTYADLPHDVVDLVILVDDGSKDETIRIARELGLELFVHDRNYGYGANQKTCYREALRAGAEIIVMVHPDYQYDPTLLPQVIAPIQKGEADVVLGSRLLGGQALQGGMPWWKYVSNRFLTWCENTVFGLRLAEYHTGYRAYTREVLEAVNLETNSDNFIFDQEIMAQFVEVGARVGEIPVPTRYFAQGLVGVPDAEHRLRTFDSGAAVPLPVAPLGHKAHPAIHQPPPQVFERARSRLQACLTAGTGS
jgi:glycosyltransferase involved in cell wall biosynthesis